MTTVTAAESRPFAKKPGERFWFVGLPVALYNGGGTPAGFSLGYGYEAENFRISVTGAGYSAAATESHMRRWKPLDPFRRRFPPTSASEWGTWAPAVTAAWAAWSSSGWKHSGCTSARADRAQLAVPFFDTQDNPAPTAIAHRSVYPAGFVRLAF